MKKSKLLAIMLIAGLSITACQKEADKKEEPKEEAKVEDKAEEGKEEGKEEGEKAQTTELTFKPGTYEAESPGYNGPMKVSVKFSENKIEDIEVVENVETDHVGTPAFDIVKADVIAANGTGVDNVSGATITSAAFKSAINKAAEEAEVSDLEGFKKNTIEVKPQEAIEETYDVVVVGAGGAGVSAAVEAAQAGNKVAIVEKNVEIGGNTLVSGGQYQSVMPYLVWDKEDPDATEGEHNGEKFEKVKSDNGRIHTLETIYNWSEEPFDEKLSDGEEFVIGDIEALSKRGVHEEYLPVLKALKEEIKAYLDWAKPQIEAGKQETDLTLFSTINLHIFQTYYGGIRPNFERTAWVYGDEGLVSQFIKEGQEIKPWLNEMGSKFDDSTQRTLIGCLWQRENQFIGSEIDGQMEEGRWATYFRAPIHKFEELNKENKIYRRADAKKLIEEDGKVVGVEGELFDGTPFTLKANKGVILATGGYAANIEMVKETNEYWDPEALEGSLKTTNRNSLMGDGIRMGKEVGADTTGEGFTQMMPISWIQDGNLAFGGGEDVIYISPKTGKRYVDESAERDVLSKGAFENGIEINGTKGVFVEVGNVESPIPGPYPYKDEDVNLRQYVREISELDDLFKELKIDLTGKQIEDAIKEYDSYVMGQTDHLDVSKESYRSLIGVAEKDENGKYKPETYKIGKIRVRFLAPSTHHTMGGLKVDDHRRVLDKEGKPISGLYAAGEVTGGIHGGNRLGGNAITEIIASGRTAAKTVEEDNK